MALYETLRADLVAGRARAEGLTALRFHGMLQGLAILLKAPAVAPSIPSAPAFPSLRCDSAFVRLLANLVLHTHAEITHVC